MPETWWRGAAIYQVYLRSFADGNGDGIGDLAGLRRRLPYLAELGRRRDLAQPVVPLADGRRRLRRRRLPRHRPGLRHAGRGGEAIQEAHALGIRIIIDVVPNHCSDQHAWFRQALAAGPGLGGAGAVLVPAGRGDGGLPPNDWQSIFGGPAWTQVAGRRVVPAPVRPRAAGLQLEQPEVREEFHDVLRFWFDRGVDGIRIDSAAVLIKDLGRRADAEPVHRPRRRARDLPRLAADLRRVRATGS